MTTMLETVVPKSDQMNADDLIGGRSITIKITGVNIVMGEQPVSLSYQGDNGKPYKPGKSMRRVIINAWGDDAKAYIGRSLTLYRDDKVKFGGLDVGGIRISHMSDIPNPITMALTASKANRKPFTVNPLVDTLEEDLRIAREVAAKGIEELTKWWKEQPANIQKKLLPYKEELKTQAEGIM